MLDPLWGCAPPASQPPGRPSRTRRSRAAARAGSPHARPRSQPPPQPSTPCSPSAGPFWPCEPRPEHPSAPPSAPPSATRCARRTSAPPPAPARGRPRPSRTSARRSPSRSQGALIPELRHTCEPCGNEAVFHVRAMAAIPGSSAARSRGGTTVAGACAPAPSAAGSAAAVPVIATRAMENGGHLSCGLHWLVAGGGTQSLCRHVVSANRESTRAVVDAGSYSVIKAISV